MARPAARALAGYYPTPTHLIPHIASLLDRSQLLMPLLKDSYGNVRQAALTAVVAILPRAEAVQRLYVLTQQPAGSDNTFGELYDEAYSTLSTLVAAAERTYAEAERCPDVRRR